MGAVVSDRLPDLFLITHRLRIGLHLLPGDSVVAGESSEKAQGLIIMKSEITSHGRGLGNRGTGEVISGCFATTFEIDIGLRGVNGPVKVTIAGEVNSCVGGQPVLL